MDVTYKNPWHRPGDSSPSVYARHDCKIYTSQCGRGMIVKAFSHNFDYVVDGRVVTQRAGKSMDILNEMISIVDGEQSANLHADRIIEAYKMGAL